jgi:integrase
MAYAEKRGDRYRGMYRDTEGKLRSAGWSTSKREAKALAQAQELKIRAGKWHSPDAGKETFSDYFEHMWLPNRILEPSTYAGYVSYYRTELKPTFGDTELRKITRADVQRWVVRMRKDGRIKPKTIREKFECLAVCLGGTKGVSAVRDGLIAESPCEGVELPTIGRRRKKAYTVAQVNTVMSRLDPWWEVHALVLADTGVRFGESQGWEVRDFRDGALYVERTVVELTKKLIAGLDLGQNTQFYVKDYPKDEEERRIALTPEVAARVEQIIRERELFPGDRIFAMHDRHGKVLRTKEWPNGRPVLRSHFRDNWRRAHGDDIEILKVHALRGSMISWLIQAGVDMGAVMDRSGHARLSTVQEYFDQFSDAEERALAGLARARAAQG